MKNILFLNTIQCKAWKNRALFLMLALVMSVANAWGHTDKHYGKMVLQNATGNGTVYLSTSSNQNAGDPSSKDPDKKNGTSWITWNCNNNESNDNKTYYARGTANDGYYYAGWAETASATTYKPATEGKSLKATSTDSSKPDSTIIYGFFKPNVKITETPAVEIYATFNPAEDSQADKTCVAVFNVENAESIDDFVDPPTIGGDDSDKFSNPQIMSYADNKVTINFVYNGNKEERTHKATLTLKVIDKKGGTDKSINIIADNKQEAVNEVSVTTAGGVTTEYATWAEGLAAANANAGCTLTLLRNIDLGSITATNSITKAMTIDLNGKTLQAAVNKASAGLLTLNAAVEVTIKDSKTGGKIINEHALNGQMRAISIDKAGAILNIQSGTIRVNNTGQYASAANADLGVDKYSACTARGIYQNANTTVNISGGRIEAVGTREVYGIVEASSAANTTYLNITGGEIYAEAPAYAYGICAFGKLNISGGTINTHINTNMVDARYAADNANNANNGYGYGIYVQTNAYATPSSCYAGTLTMTGGTVNVVSDRTKTATLPNYGIYINTKVASVGAGKTATDGTQSEKASAAASIENAIINVTSGTNSSHGVVARGSYNSYDQTYRKTTIRNSIINVKANTNAYGVYADAVINSSSYAYGAHAGKIELTDNNNITATTTGKNAFGVYVHAASNTTAVDVVAAEVEITGGTYKAIAANTTAYAVHSAAKQIQGEKETAPSIVINSGKFWSEATSTYADISSACVPGYCVVKGGYYKNDANVSSMLQEGYNVFPLQQNKAEHKEAYNEGYRWHVTTNVTGEAVWEVYNNTNTLLGTFDNLNSALDVAKGQTNSKVVPTTNYTLPAGKYTIPSNVTLLIPYDDAYTVVHGDVKAVQKAGTNTDEQKPTKPVKKRELTLDESAKITVLEGGTIEVGGEQNVAGQTAVTIGGVRDYGAISMKTGSQITLNGGANLYCWGFITAAKDKNGNIIGEGKITAESGASVYECLQIRDWKGGTASYDIVNNSSKYKAFPVCQYYIQNVEVPILFKVGAKGYVKTGVELTLVGTAQTENVLFIGSAASAFFQLEGDTQNGLERNYDEKTDRQVYDLNCNASLNNITLKISYINIKSSDYVMPITNNFSLYVNSGSTITINSEISLCADTKVHIKEGASVYLKQPLYVYDEADWGKNFASAKRIRPLQYAQGIEFLQITGNNTCIRKPENIKDASLCVDGTLYIETPSALYTTIAGGNICSTKNGKVIFNVDAPNDTKDIYHVTSTTPTYDTITCNPAWLHNDESKTWNQDEKYKYTPTKGALANDVFTYSKTYGRWRCERTITWEANGGTIEPLPTVVGKGEPLSLYFPESLPTPTRVGYTFNGWFTEASGGTQITTTTVVEDNVTYHAQWKLNIVGTPLDIVDADGTYLTINTNGWASSGWQYTINGTTYTKEQRAADRTLVIPYGDKDPNEEIVIEVKDESDEVISHHIYKVPFVYTGDATMSGTDENSIVFVKSGTLTVGDALAKEIYVAPGAELKVNGTLTVGKLVLRTTPYKAAILTIENGGAIADGGQVFYSRISPDAKQYYQFGLPLSCALANVKMSNTDKLGGSQPKYGTAWMLKSYSESSRAQNGISNEGANWNLLPSDGTITAGVGYEMFSNSKYYREFYFPVDLTTATNKVSVQYTDGTIAEHNGWNIITSPLTSRANVPIIGDPATAIKVCWLNEDGSYRQEQPTIIPPAIPFSYQASTGGELNFAVPTIAAAPRKQSAAEALTETEWVHLDIFDAYGEGDETSLFVHPTRFEQTYKTGIDVAKQSLTASRAILYTTHAYGDMAFAGVADSLLENGIDLVVYSPSAQELTFSLRKNKFLNRLEYLWLADNETGARTDLLIDDYTFRADAGTAKGRFVLNGRFKAPQISTGIGNTQTDYNIYAIGNNIAISGVEQGTPIYVFDAVGHMIYTTAATSDEVIVPAPCAGVYMLTIGGQTAKLVINQ